MDPQEVSIDGVDYQITPLPAMRALRLKPRLLAVLGPTIAQVRRVSLEQIQRDKDLSMIGEAITAFAGRMTPDELELLVKELLYSLRKRTDPSKPFLPCGPGDTFNNEFAGRTATVYRLIGFAFEVNYRDFFSAVSGQLGAFLSLLTAETKEAASGSAGSTT